MGADSPFPPPFPTSSPRRALPEPPQMKCDRHFPCGRCFRIGQQCRPPPEYMEEHYPAEAALDVVDVKTAEDLLPTPPTATLLLVELSVKTTNPWKLVEEFMSIFHERLAEGDLCRKRTIKMLYV